MKRIFLALLAVLLVIGSFAAAGYAGYRFGHTQGMLATADGDTVRPGFRPFDEFSPRRMPMQDFGFGRGPGRGFGGLPMLGFGFFPVLMLLGRIAVLALIIWFIYWLFTQSGWRLTRQATESVPPKTENE